VTTYRQVPLVGAMFRSRVARAIVRTISVGDRSLSLVREPSNPHDPDAIKVFRLIHLGYIARDFASFIAAELDAGFVVTEVVVSLRLGYYQIFLDITLESPPCLTAEYSAPTSIDSDLCSTSGLTCSTSAS
jgi:hypothetical protein